MGLETMSRRAHDCDECGKTRVGVTVVHGRDLCPECAELEAAKADRPDPADVAALDLSDLGEDEEPMVFECSLLVPAGVSVGRPCRRSAERIYAHESAPGLTIWFALCDEHAELLAAALEDAQ